MNSFSYAATSLLRAGSRTVAYLLGLGLAVALFSGTLFFMDGSARSMTLRAAAPVLLDFQARSIDPKTDIAQFASQLQAQKGVKAVLPFVSAAISIVPSSTVTTTTPPANPRSGGSNLTGQVLAARLFAVPLEYPTAFPLLTVSSGKFEAGGVLVSEQMALSLHLKPGDTLNLTVPGLSQPYPVKLSGTVNTDLADPLFNGPKAAPEGSYNFAAAVVVMDYQIFQRDLAGPIQGASDQANQNPNSATTPGNLQGLPLLDRQQHINIDRSILPSDPGEAQLAITTLSRNLERQASGQIRITNNLGDALKGAAGDVVAARLLFIFLGLPGVLLAAYLSRNAAELVSEAQHSEVALLRSRGISPQKLLEVFGWTAILVAIIGTALGLVIGALSTTAIFGTGVFNNTGGLLLSALYSLLLGLVLGGIGVFLPARQMLKGEVNEERRLLKINQRPVWLRLPLYLILLAAAGLALWFSGTYNSRTATAGASETAAVSLGIYSFIGPLLFWLGAALLFLRILDWFLRRPSAKWRGGLNGLAGRSLRRRSQQSAGAALLVALAFSFGVVTATFGASYEASRVADSRYIIGSDLRLTPALTNLQPTSFAGQLKVPGVQAVAPVWLSNNVLVGSQTQTVYGVDLPSFLAATTIPDSFFSGESAKTVLDRLAATPNGLLVSNELANSYNILLGDPVNMRIPDTSGAYYDAKLQVVGIFTMFPTSSQNSDLVVNSTYLTQATKNPNPGFFLVKGDGTTVTIDNIAGRLTQQFKAQQLAVRIETASHAISQDQSSLAGLNLSGLMAIDRFFSALIMALGLGVFLLGTILERQRELGTLQALGATRQQVTRLLLLEGFILVASGIAGGLVIGLLLAWQYNGFLTGIFAVALPVLALPLFELGLLLGLGLVGVLAASFLVTLRLRRLWPAEVLREA
jgi:putative ABC transport system permease protein